MEESKKHICKYCHKEFKNGQSLGAHIIHCTDNPNNYQVEFVKRKKDKYNINNPLNEYNLKCKICGKEYKLQIRQKQYELDKYRKTCSNECAHKLSSLHTNFEEKNKKISNSNKSNYIPKIKICEYCKSEYVSYNKSKFCCEECRKLSKHNKLSELSKNINFGGYHPNSIKKHHHGNYKGIHCDSSWELAYLVYCLEHNINIKRCNEVRYYKINKKICKYFPDFIINDNQIIEIKGFLDKGSQIKAEQNPDITVLLYDDLKEMIEYTINKYGNKYWDILYE